MKRLLIALLVLSSCSKGPLTMNRCGRVVGRYIQNPGPNATYYLKISFSGNVVEERVTEMVFSNSRNGETKCFN